ncbi:MAG: hypothetical protein JNM36_12715 [Chitinophagales bacterium]|nr:hypothetical protein [Chitinophagales bacterium]
MTNNNQSRFIREFQLQQHTPIIHFQADQDGATLRATELKPKLDKFIIAKESWQNDPTSTDKDWKKNIKKEARHFFIGKNQAEFPALDYKVRITEEGNAKNYIFASLLNGKQKDLVSKNAYIPISPAPYFADNQFIKSYEADFDSIRKGVLCEGSITVTFFSLNTDLLDIIDKYFEEFLLLHNFGTRQSKGFGSFTTANLNDERITEIFRQNARPVFCSIQTYIGIDQIFKMITDTYQVLKSGKGKKNSDGIRQTPSKLQQHYLTKKIEGLPVVWEAVPIKDCLYYRKENREQADGAKQIVAWPNERYIRILLGLAEEYVYMQASIPIDKVKINDLAGEIERFKSPLTFKVVNKHIYILCGEIPDDLYERTFEFSADDRVPLHIKTPPLEMILNLGDFLKNYLGKDWKQV